MYVKEHITLYCNTLLLSLPASVEHKKEASKPTSMQWALVLLRNYRKNKMRDSSKSLCILHGMGTYAFLHFQCATSEYGVYFFRTKKNDLEKHRSVEKKNRYYSAWSSRREHYMYECTKPTREYTIHTIHSNKWTYPMLYFAVAKRNQKKLNWIFWDFWDSSLHYGKLDIMNFFHLKITANVCKIQWEQLVHLNTIKIRRRESIQLSNFEWIEANILLI